MGFFVKTGLASGMINSAMASGTVRKGMMRRPAKVLVLLMEEVREPLRVVVGPVVRIRGLIVRDSCVPMAHASRRKNIAMARGIARRVKMKPTAAKARRALLGTLGVPQERGKPRQSHVSSNAETAIVFLTPQFVTESPTATRVKTSTNVIVSLNALIAAASRNLRSVTA